MSWNFCNIRLKGFGPTFPSEWCLRITTEDELEEYIRKTNGSRIHRAMKNGGEVLRGVAHFNNGLAMVAEARARNMESSFVLGLVNVLDQVFEQQMRLLAQGNILYMKASGGYSFDDEEGSRYELLQIKEDKEIAFPFTEVRYISWPGGKHVYAKAGDVDIEWEGKQKWDTQQEAEKAVKDWRRSRGMRSANREMDQWG